MPKRSFAELDGSDLSITQALARVNDLLATAENLKRDLEKVRDARQAPEKQEFSNYDLVSSISTTLKKNSDKVIETAQLISQDVVEGILKADNTPHKSQKSSHFSSQANVPADLPGPHPTSLTTWTLEDIPPDGRLPPLPSIADNAIERAALTHSGMSSQSTDLGYEKLEWIGDAYMYLISSAYIFNTFPLLSVGRSAQLREKIVKNDTLRGYTLSYGLNMRANFPAEFDLHGRTGGTAASNKSKNKVLGDIFESYFAAIILGNPNGLAVATDFIKKVWAATLAYEIRQEYKAVDLHRNQAGQEAAATERREQNFKVELAKTIGGPSINIAYKQIGEKKSKETGAPLYTMGVFLDGWGEIGLQMGFGTALSKKDAGQKAAAMALSNKKLMKRLSSMKTDFLKAVAAQKEKEAEQVQS